MVNQFESQIASFTLIPSSGGRFEVTVNDQLIYSKLKTGRHVEPGEVAGLFRKLITEGK